MGKRCSDEKRSHHWVGISYGELKLEPDLAPLRGDPRFEKKSRNSRRKIRRYCNQETSTSATPVSPLLPLRIAV